MADHKALTEAEDNQKDTLETDGDYFKPHQVFIKSSNGLF